MKTVSENAEIGHSPAKSDRIRGTLYLRLVSHCRHNDCSEVFALVLQGYEDGTWTFWMPQRGGSRCNGRGTNFDARRGSVADEDKAEYISVVV